MSDTTAHGHGHWGPHDHAAGLHGHVHDEHDPFHTHAGEAPVTGLSPEEAGNRLSLTSVGIDIGSSTSHLVFSRLVLERQGLALSSRFKVVERTILHRSPILLTPYIDPMTIDTDELSRFIEGVYADAGLSVDDVDTGATIFTGEAAKKRNAEALATIFAQQAGKFVCATAGPNLEAVMAAHGSGACARSAAGDGSSKAVLNVDIGGGTAKMAVCRDGEIVETAAINVGARLVAMDEDGRVFRIEPAGRIIAEELGIPLELGQTLPERHQQEMATLLAETLINAAERRPLKRLTDRLMITAPLTYRGPIDEVTFSGGISEYVYGNETRSFGDLGILLGRAVWERVDRLGAPLKRSDQGIRATVIGAGQYTIQVSGSTIYISRPGMLPHRNLQVVTPLMPEGRYTVDMVRDSVQEALRRLDVEEGEAAIALSFRWRMDPSYDRVGTLVDGIIAGLPETISKRVPITVVFDTDIGGAVGTMLTRRLPPGHDVVSVDEVVVGDLDYIDLAEERADVHAVPVVVKSLVFTTARERDSGLTWETGAPPHAPRRDADDSRPLQAGP